MFILTPSLKMSRSSSDVAIDVGLRPEKLDEACSEAMFVSLAGSLDPWRLIFCGLLTDVELNDVEAENHSEQEKRVACLRKWKAKNGERATYRVLVQAAVNNERLSKAEEMCRRLAEADSKYACFIIPWTEIVLERHVVCECIGLMKLSDLC